MYAVALTVLEDIPPEHGHGGISLGYGLADMLVPFEVVKQGKPEIFDLTYYT